MNKYLIIGNITKDIELRTTTAGKEVCTLSVAVNNGRDDTTFLDIGVFGQQAQNCARYLHKGSKVAAECMIKNHNYQKQDGTKVYGYSFLANHVEFLSPKNESYESPTGIDIDAEEGLPF